MFTSLDDKKVIKQTSAPLSNQRIAQKALSDALIKIASLTGLTHLESKTLVTQQLLTQTFHADKPSMISDNHIQIPTKILNRHEVTFISNLFH